MSTKNKSTENENVETEVVETEATQAEDQPKTKRVSPTKPSDMSEDLIEFITAIDEYKRVHQRPFPSLGEVFDVLKSLGYERPEDSE